MSEIAAALEAEAAKLLKLAEEVRALEANGEERTNGEADRLLTAREVAERTGLPRTVVYRLGREGQLGAIKLGERGVRFSARGLAEWQRQRSAP